MWYLVQDQLSINQLCYNFLPSWWRGYYGLNFGEKFWFDPDYRVELYRFMERTVHARFPSLHIGSPDPEPQVITPDFGNATTPAAAGCEIIYPEDNYPWNKHLSDEKIDQLKLPSGLDGIFPYREITSQVKYLNHKLDKDAAPWWNERGILNDAMLIGGSDFFVELTNHTEKARILVNFSRGILNSVIRQNHCVFGHKKMIILANCAVMMVSPTMYIQDVLELDRQVHQLVISFDQPFGIHHCGYFDKYGPAYRQIPKIDWLEIGWESSIRKTLDLFPEAIVQYILSAAFLQTASRNEVKEKMFQILEAAYGDWYRFRLSMPDVEYGTPDENLYEIFDACKRSISMKHG